MHLLLLKKIWPRNHDANFVQRSEFQSLQITVESLRDKIDARSLAIGEKIDRLSESLHKRLNELEAGLARVDERTRGRQ